MFGDFFIVGYALMALNIPTIFPLRTSLPNPQVSAKSVLVIDAKTGRTLFEKKSKDILPLASLTKLLSSLVILDTLQLDKEVTISQDIIDTQGELGGFVVGEKVEARHLLFSALIHSSNDAMAALAFDLGKENFFALVKNKILQLGLKNTTITDPTGLDPNTVGSPVDVSIFAQAAFSNDFLRKILAIPEYNFTSRSGIFHKVVSTNPLIYDPRVIVAKTGTLESVGQNYAALIKPSHAPNELILVILGSNNREKDALAILNWLEKAYVWN